VVFWFCSLGEREVESYWLKLGVILEIVLFFVYVACEKDVIKLSVLFSISAATLVLLMQLYPILRACLEDSRGF
jgi:hypothetical protein